MWCWLGHWMAGMSKMALLTWPGVQSCWPGALFLSMWLMGLPCRVVVGFQEDTDQEPKEKPQRHDLALETRQHHLPLFVHKAHPDTRGLKWTPSLAGEGGKVTSQRSTCERRHCGSHLWKCNPPQPALWPQKFTYAHM